MTEHPNDPFAAVRKRVWHVMAMAAVGFAAAGLLIGLARPPERGRSEDSTVSTGPVVPGYEDLRGMRRGPNAHLYARGTEPLAVQVDLQASVERSDEERDAALEARDARRAYDGAPPTIPHAIDQRGFPDCLACHGAAVRIDGKIAPTMSHRRYDNCVQCHVVDADPRPGGKAPEGVPNSFVGVSAANPGERAWPEAPPTIPHPTNMRSDCLACHGPLGKPGLRTTHPWRQSCTQCHAPSAELDQRSAVFPGAAP